MGKNVDCLEEFSLFDVLITYLHFVTNQGAVGTVQKYIIDIIVLQWSAPSFPHLRSRHMDSCLKKKKKDRASVQYFPMITTLLH